MGAEYNHRLSGERESDWGWMWVLVGAHPPLTDAAVWRPHACIPYADAVTADLLRTALLIPVPEAEPLVGQWRQSYDPSASHGVPPHVTLIFPYLPSGRCTRPVVEELGSYFAGSAGFRFELRDLGGFPGILYLAPAPAEPFIRLIQGLVQRFPDAPPYGGAFPSIIPHLTVAHTTDEAVKARISAELTPELPVQSLAREVLLMREDVDGQWRLSERFPLGLNGTRPVTR